MNLEEQFLEAQKCKVRNYGKLVQLQKRLFDEWALDRFRDHGYAGFKMSYMAFLMNIDEKGITNKELAEKAHVTKQAMSKSMKEIERLGLAETKLHETDARMTVISLTEKGKQVVITVVESVTEKMREYEELLGKDRFLQAMDTMFDIVDYEKKKLGNKSLRGKMV